MGGTLVCAPHAIRGPEILLDGIDSETPCRVAIVVQEIHPKDELTVCRGIKARQDGTTLPVMLITAFEQARQPTEVEEFGFAVSLPQPIQYAHLWENLSNLIQGDAVTQTGEATGPFQGGSRGRHARP